MKTLELSNTDGHYYEEIPKDHISQGFFEFPDNTAFKLIHEQQMNMFVFPEQVKRVVPLYDSITNKFLGFVDENQLNEVRIQVLKHGIQGLGVRFSSGNESDFILISPETGDLDKWPTGLFDEKLHTMAQIIRLKNAKKGII